MKIRLTRCWLVEVTDDKGKEIEHDFSFGTKKDAKATGEKLKSEIENLSQSTRIDARLREVYSKELIH